MLNINCSCIMLKFRFTALAEYVEPRANPYKSGNASLGAYYLTEFWTWGIASVTGDAVSTSHLHVNYKVSNNHIEALMKGACRYLTVLTSDWWDHHALHYCQSGMYYISDLSCNNLRNLECSTRNSIDCSMKQDGRAQAENMDQVLGLMYPFLTCIFLHLSTLTD